mmetsp:Transcript_69259/g.129313  ORF Transcript_69259/g.129313 Transcript_69259/m.129313 type:complete len:412 (+) Transcript_69259:67-1302(+)
MEQQHGESSYGDEYTFESDPFAAPRFYPSNGMQPSWQPQQFAQCYGAWPEMPMQSQAVAHMQFGTSLDNAAHNAFAGTEMHHSAAGMESMHGEFAGLEQPGQQQQAQQQPMMFLAPAPTDPSQWQAQAQQQAFDQSWHVVPAMAWAPVAPVAHMQPWGFARPEWGAHPSSSSSSTGPAPGQLPQPSQGMDFAVAPAMWPHAPAAPSTNGMQFIMAPAFSFPGYAASAVAMPSMQASQRGSLPQGTQVHAASNADIRHPLENPVPEPPAPRGAMERLRAALLEETRVAQVGASCYQRALRFSAEGKCEEGACKEPCSICLEDMTKGQMLRTLPCFHMFHKDCAEQYFQRESMRLGEDENIGCPLCRFPVGPEVIDVDFDESPHSPAHSSGFNGGYVGSPEEAQLSSAEDDDA